MNLFYAVNPLGVNLLVRVGSCFNKQTHQVALNLLQLSLARVCGARLPVVGRLALWLGGRMKPDAKRSPLRSVSVAGCSIRDGGLVQTARFSAVCQLGRVLK